MIGGGAGGQGNARTVNFASWATLVWHRRRRLAAAPALAVRSDATARAGQAPAEGDRQHDDDQHGRREQHDWEQEIEHRNSLEHAVRKTAEVSARRRPFEPDGAKDAAVDARRRRTGGSAWESNPPGPPLGQPPLVLKTRPDTSPDPLPNGPGIIAAVRRRLQGAACFRRGGAPCERDAPGKPGRGVEGSSGALRTGLPGGWDR